VGRELAGYVPTKRLAKPEAEASPWAQSSTRKWQFLINL
jgi:hypothetical protein